MRTYPFWARATLIRLAEEPVLRIETLNHEGEVEDFIWGVPIERDVGPLPTNHGEIALAQRARDLDLPADVPAPIYGDEVLPDMESLVAWRDGVVAETCLAKWARHHQDLALPVPRGTRRYAPDGKGGWWHCWISCNLMYGRERELPPREPLSQRDEIFRRAYVAWQEGWVEAQRADRAAQVARERVHLARHFGLPDPTWSPAPGVCGHCGGDGHPCLECGCEGEK